MEGNDAATTMKLISRNRALANAANLPTSSSPHASPSSLSPVSSSPPTKASSSNNGHYDGRNGTRYHTKSIKNVVRHIAQRLWFHWRRLETKSKIVTAVTAIIILQYSLIQFWDYCLLRTGMVYTSNRPVKSSEQYFAVVINTYKRPDMLRQAVQHYADACGTKYRVGQVFVVWAEQNVTVPSPESFFDNSNAKAVRTSTNNKETGHPTRAEVTVLQVSKDSLNSRFEPIPQLITTSVFMVDDDIRVSCPSLRLGFQAWTENPNSMVGFYPRLSSPPIRSTGTVQTELIYHAWPIVYWRHKMNFVLTKASFLHSKYLELYTNDDTFPKQIKDHVDQHMNCEDIAMSMLVANFTRYQVSIQQETKRSDQPPLPARPIYVEGQVSDLGLFGGISTGAGHMTTRSDCLTQLSSIFVSKGWGLPLEHDFDLQESSYVHHAPGFRWQTKPSNFFEWLAFANTFT
ncbi:glycosyl transferase family 64 protein [Nitzschia inconspicua]|uniref:Glycosyl transferase family 64 protein n=1 Tax=Nitzschia inconspicua TaxID=303405 RepID=A0A9K3Q5M1_9STRA|nr:glycosyl transferase family 64 protein [Nitzschia inconspicua]